MIVALFDLDGTLYTGHLGHAIMRYHRLHRTHLFYLYAFMSANIVTWPAWRLGLVSEARMRNVWVRNMAWTVRGWAPAEAAKAFTWITEEYAAPRAREGILARLREHQRSGHRVILVSGTFSPLLAQIGRQWGVLESVGTPLVVHKGRYTGGCERPVCQGPGKWLRVKAYLGDDHIDWDRSYAYADSHADLCLLEKVGHPVAVYPDDQLAAHAQQHGWEIIEDEESADDSAPAEEGPSERRA